MFLETASSFFEFGLETLNDVAEGYCRTYSDYPVEQVCRGIDLNNGFLDLPLAAIAPVPSVEGADVFEF